MKLEWLLSGSLAVIVLTSCAAPEQTGPHQAPEALAASVTGEAARRLGADGRFILPAPQVENYSVLSEAEARGAAEYAARNLASLAGPLLRSQHGSPIHWASLTVCGPSYYAQSPFTSLPGNLPDAALHYLGSHWVVAVCSSDGRATLSIAVAAGAVEIREMPGGWFIPPGAIRMVGIPPTWEGALPVSPEGAVILAAERSKAKVATVPVLYAPNPFDAFPQGAYWRFEMDATVELTGRTTGASNLSTLLRVGSAPIPSNSMLRGQVDVFAPLPGSRLVLEVPFTTREGVRTDVRLHVRPDASLDLERATVRKAGAQ